MTHTLVLGVVAVTLITAVSFGHLRNVWLAIAIAIGPLPALIAAHLILHPFVLRDLIMIATFCVFIFERIASATIASDRLSWRAFFNACRRLNVSRATACFCGFLFAGFWLHGFEAAVSIDVIALLAVGSSAVSLWLASRIAGSNEVRIANANRWRERNERLLEIVVHFVRRRWAFAIFGMGFAAFAIAFFSTEAPRAILATNMMLLLAMLGIAAVCSTSISQDWRKVTAVICAFAWAALMDVWIVTFRGAVLKEASLSNYVFVLGLTLAAILEICAEQTRLTISESTKDVAGALIAQGASFFFAALGAGAFLGMLRIGHFVPLSMAMTFVPLIASLFIYLATVSVLETLFPRRVPLEDRYKLK